MYNIEMFKGIMAEGEILVMSDSFMDALVLLIDDKIGIRLIEFFKRFDESNIANINEPIANLLTKKVEKLREKSATAIAQNTFHLRAKERNLFELTNTLTVENALASIKDPDKAIEDLEWLFENEDYWIAQIQPRAKVAYKRFMEEVAEMPQAIARFEGYVFTQQGIDLKLKSYPNVLARVKANKELFLSRVEAPRSTKMARILYLKPQLVIILHGLKYNKLCREKRMTVSERRSLN